MLKQDWKKALVVGAGISGISAAKLLISKKIKVYISDKKSKAEIKKFPKDAIFINEKKAESIIEKIDFIVKSPGISHSHSLLKKANELNKPVFSEIDIALFFCKTKNIIAITGTNGKTTTTTLTYLIMKNFLSQKGLKAIVCGNIGKPATSEIPKAKVNDWIIMEISSYQLEDSKYFAPKISALLNITPDHIEHHTTLENYIKAKEKIFINQSEKDYSIFNYNDEILRDLSLKSKAKKLYFSSSSNERTNAFYKNGKIYVNFEKQKYIFKPPSIPGIHNIENSMAAILCALAAGANKNSIQKTLNDFKGIEHRIEKVAKINGITFINDSKATNVDSTLIALKAIGNKKNIWLILGGLDKGSPYTPLIPFIKKYVKKILTVGLAAEKINNELKDTVDIIPAYNIKNAIKIIYKNAEKGDIALLSPACASYDQFKNFEDRGRKFKKWVKTFAQ